MNFTLKILITLLILPCLFGCATNNSANNIDKKTQFEMGLKAFVIEDYSRAIYWLEQAHNKAPDQYYFSGNTQKLLREGESGNPDAKYLVAYMYQNGLGVDKDERKAKRFLESAPNLLLEVQWPSTGRFVVVLRSNASQFYRAFQRTISPATVKAEREAKGIFEYSKLLPETSEIEFAYGSPAVQKMSFADFEDFVKSQVSDHTISTHNFIQGTQIEYFSPSGEVALWYPVNQTPVVGKYYTKQSMKPHNLAGNVAGVLLCFSYQPNSYNPVTGTRGDADQCTSAYSFLAQIKGKRRGDVFNLFSGALPHSFQKGSPPKWPDGKNIVDDFAPHRVR
tara:strand:- start:11197 stop:12204 length:1008 start_codon:yes stop_codon:yes gene_type:complete